VWGTTQLAHRSGTDISSEIYLRTLYQPYHIHTSRNTSELISGAGKVGHSVNILFQSLTIFSTSLLIITIITTIFIINSQIAIFLGLFLGGSYLIISLFTRYRLNSISRDISIQSTNVIKLMQEGLGGIRDILLDGTQKIFTKIYTKSDLTLRLAQAESAFISRAPRYAMEGLGMIGIAILAFYLTFQEQGLTAVLPTIAFVVLGIQRLLPSMQQCYNSWVIFRGLYDSLGDTIKLLEQPIENHLLLNKKFEKLKFEKSINLIDLHYYYEKESGNIIDGLDLKIKKGSRVCFVGETGSGKSTLLDLIMGFYKPVSGYINIDEETINSKNIKWWQKNIAHVPQSIYLTDSTIAENIAFGIPYEKINMRRLEDVAKKANIYDFINSKDEKFLAKIGERGTQISGGQKQRLGIARALYKKPKLLVLDEATSGLDRLTEELVINSLENIDKEITIIMVAHRETTMKSCDRIIELKNGKINFDGSYNDYFNGKNIAG
jgi:ATP-binding cassette subfamily B protein